MTEVAENTGVLDVQKIHLHIEDFGGEGRPIVLIHGWPLSGASWKLQVPALQEAGYRVITYDRRGFGQSDKPKSGYDYDEFTKDLNGLIENLDVRDITLVGFSMGGGEVARYLSKYGESRIHSVVFASSVTPMLLKTPANPEGPLEEASAKKMTTQLTANPELFYEGFVKEFFSPNADGNTLVTDEQLQEALALTKQADPEAALKSLQAFAATDFRQDLKTITVPTLIMHGDDDGIVLLKGSADRTHTAISQSKLHIIKGGPHGINVSHVDEFNQALLEFLNE